MAEVSVQLSGTQPEHNRPPNGSSDPHTRGIPELFRQPGSLAMVGGVLLSACSHLHRRYRGNHVADGNRSPARCAAPPSVQANLDDRHGSNRTSCHVAVFRGVFLHHQLVFRSKCKSASHKGRQSCVDFHPIQIYTCTPGASCTGDGHSFGFLRRGGLRVVQTLEAEAESSRQGRSGDPQSNQVDAGPLRHTDSHVDAVGSVLRCRGHASTTATGD